MNKILKENEDIMCKFIIYLIGILEKLFKKIVIQSLFKFMKDIKFQIQKVVKNLRQVK